MYFIHPIIILIDNDANKVQQKFPLEICLVYLKF